MKPVVRVAGPADHTEVLRLFISGHAENGHFKLAPEKLEYSVQRALWPEHIPPDDTGPRGVIGVIGEPSSLEALAMLVIGELWYSRDKYLGDWFVFVDPAHRKSTHAKRLLEWMREQSRLTGLPLMCGVTSSERTETKCALYRRLFPKIGEVFLWRSS